MLCLREDHRPSIPRSRRSKRRDKGFVWHRVRHESASKVNEREKDIKKAQVQIRHRHVSTTQRYVHTESEGQWDVAQRVGKRG